MNILDYNLPKEKIAFKPKDQREDSKLLAYMNGSIKEYIFSDIVSLLDSQYNLVLNETKVVNARIFFKKETGARLEIFCLEPAEGDITEQLTRTNGVRWNCFVGGAKKWKEGLLTAEIKHEGEEVKLYAERLSVKEGVFELLFTWSDDSLSFSEILEIFQFASIFLKNSFTIKIYVLFINFNFFSKRYSKPPQRSHKPWLLTKT